MRVRGTVRKWRKKKGWGVIDSPEAPGGCWALAADIEDIEGDSVLLAGERVDLDATADPHGRGGCAWRATHVVPVDEELDGALDAEDQALMDAEDAVIEDGKPVTVEDFVRNANLGATPCRRSAPVGRIAFGTTASPEGGPASEIRWI